MATRIMSKRSGHLNISVKYTVIQRRHGLWLPINEYYQFSLRECRQLEPVPGPAAKIRYECPACLRTFTELALPEHRCSGGAAGYPRLNNQVLKNNQRWRPAAAFKPIRLEDIS